MSDSLLINSPKRKKGPKSKRNEFFPYYAGFPESFAQAIIKTSGIPKSGLVFDPWNGSGTTTYSASKLGFNSFGIDLNPVMVIVARARNLSNDDSASLDSNIEGLLKDLGRLKTTVSSDDPLLQWFCVDSASLIRNLERRIRTRFIFSSQNEASVQIESISSLAACFYVAVFSMCRSFTHNFRSSNPTWLKLPKSEELKIVVSVAQVGKEFRQHIRSIVAALPTEDVRRKNNPRSTISVGNTTNFQTPPFVDLILTSPPYCTRIDYTSATRIELAITAPLLNISRDELSREMIGSIRVPVAKITPDKNWGPTCLKFLEKLISHESKASKGYYYKTHLDYFEKIYKSLGNIRRSLKPKGIAVLVVQDSYYKEVHNDLPKILIEMAESVGFSLFLKKDFSQSNSMSKINSSSKKYKKSTSTTESVICFKKGK